MKPLRSAGGQVHIQSLDKASAYRPVIRSAISMPNSASRTTSNGRARSPVLIVNSTLHIGGAEQVAGCLAQGMDRRLFDVAACYLKEAGTIADQMFSSGVELLQLPGFRAGERDYLSSLKLRRLIRSRGIKIIHTHDIHGMIDGSVCRLLLPELAVRSYVSLRQLPSSTQATTSLIESTAVAGSGRTGRGGPQSGRADSRLLRDSARRGARHLERRRRSRLSAATESDSRTSRRPAFR